VEPKALAVTNSLLWMLDVTVCEGSSPWIAPARNHDLRKVRSVLDRYARPRVILPPTGDTDFREDLIALIALFARKGQCLPANDEKLPGFFRSYCDRFFSGERDRRMLSEAEWHGVIDLVFLRLYGGKFGAGFTMPAFPGSFRAYIARALRGGAASARRRDRPVGGTARFPSCIDEAARKLNVSHMTIRRRMRRLGFREWTELAWTEISEGVHSKKRWQAVNKQLLESGLRKEAARKRVQRWKGRGLTLEQARNQSSAVKQQRQTCTACTEERALGSMLDGKFFCAECFREKAGIQVR
jgi:hypothetical protein